MTFSETNKATKRTGGWTKLEKGTGKQCRIVFIIKRGRLGTLCEL